MTAGVSGDDDVSAPDRPDDASESPAYTGSARLLGFAIPTVVLLAVVVSLRRNGANLVWENLSVTWQLDDLNNLGAHPFRSTWYRHVQPPLYNLTIGSILRWSPFPPVGTIYTAYLLALLATALLLTDILAKWRVHPVAAGAVASLTVVNPALLSTVVWNSYEIPVAFLLVLAVWCIQRFLDRPTAPALVGVAATLTACSLTRSLIHPVIVVALVAAVGVLRRVELRQLVAALAIPVVLVGGWMIKNQILFGSATTSSWLGFNMQRGIVAPMAADDVERAVADGTVTSLAHQEPWLTLDRYGPWLDGCEPRHGDPSVSSPTRTDSGIANYNQECYLPLYDEAQANAAALVRKYPRRYLWSRAVILPSSFAVPTIGTDDPTSFTAVTPPTRTWMDDVADVWLWKTDASISTKGWNLPFLDGRSIDFKVSITLALLFGLAVLRSAVALLRIFRTRAEAASEEILWAALGGLVIVVVLGGNLVEFGENGRFRANLDPLVVSFVLGAAYRTFTTTWRRIENRRGDDQEQTSPRTAVGSGVNLNP